MFEVIILALIFVVFYMLMIGTMLILERDKPKYMIIWSIIFLFMQIAGYFAYFIIKLFQYKKRAMLIKKMEEDSIYKNLIKNNIVKSGNGQINCSEIFKFNGLVYSTSVSKNNEIQIIDDTKELINIIKSDIMSAQKSINIELSKITKQFFNEFLDDLLEKSKSGVNVKIVTEHNVDFRQKNLCVKNGIKIYYFSKVLRMSKKYQNLRSLICIDGRVVHIGDFICAINNDKMKALCEKKKQIKGSKKQLSEISNVTLRICGDVVQDVEVAIYQDILFSSGKHFDKQKSNEHGVLNECIAQYISNEINTNIELLIVKAISMAKSSVEIHAKEFIPTESIMSLIKFAIDSGVKVKLMVPIKATRHSKYYASRAYAKELALLGADVYLFDGYINGNSITIDDEYVIFGSYIMDREFISTSNQNALLINDKDIVKIFKNLFKNEIENSYKIKDAKYMLLREKFFKNFV